MSQTFWNDEAGAILSGELVLILTILVIGLVVGLSELQDSIVNELNDVGEGIGSLNQSFFYHGQSGTVFSSIKSSTFGSSFDDQTDNCDGNECAISCDVPVPEAPK